MADNSKTREQLLAEVRELRQRLAALEQGQRQQLEKEQVLNEELQIANEELQVQAEELRVANEDLEVQAEELQTQNEELQAQRDELARLAADLEAQNLLLEAVLHQMPGAVIIAEAPSGRVILSNVQKNPLQGFHANGRPYRPAEWPLARSLHWGEKVIDKEIRVAQDDGSHRILSVNSTPVLDHRGRIIAGVEISFDITERQRAEAQIRWLASFPQLNPNPVMEMDLSGAITYSNEAALAALAEQGGGEVKPEDLLPADLEEILEAAGEPGKSRFYREVRLKNKVFAEDIHYAEPFEVLRLYARDITERRRGEEALRRATEEWERTFDAVPDLIAILDDDHRIVRANRAMARALGKTPLELVGLKCYEHMHRASCPPDFCPHAKLLADGREHNAEVHELGRDFLVTASPLTDDRGKVCGSVHVARDITARKRAEEAMRREKNFFEATIESLPGIFYLFDSQGRYLKWNKNFEVVSGYSPEEIARMNPLDFFLDEEKQPIGQRIQEVFTEGKSSAEGAFVSKDGRQTPYFFTGLLTTIDQQNCVIGMGIDITDLREAEEALRESQRDLNRAQAVARTGSWRLDVRRNELVWSDETYRIFEVSPGTSLTYEAFLSAVHPDDREYVDQKWTSAMTGEPYDIEHRIVVGDAVKWVRELAELEFDSHGQLLGGFGTVQDITERRRAEEALRLSNQRLDLLAETAGELLVSDSPQQIVDSLCWRVMEFLDCDAFFNFLVVDEKAGLLHLNACAGIPEEEAHRIQWLEFGAAVCGCAARDGCRIVSEDIQTTDDPRTDLVKSYGIQAYACHPLLLGSRVLGTLSFGTRKKPNFAADELALMKAVADQVAIAMDRKLAEEALSRAKDELEQRVAERTEDLEETVAQLEEEISDRQRAEAALDTERKRLFAVLESMPAHVSLIRPDHTYAYANGEFVRRFGEPGEMHCYERMGLPGPCTECQAMAVFQTGTPVIWEWTGPDDKVYQIFDYPFIDVDGSPLVLEMGIDITAARQSEAEIRQQAALLDLAHDAIIVRDLDSRILFWNRGAEETYGFQKAAALNQMTHSLLQTQSPIPLGEIDQALRQQGHWSGELGHIKADGNAMAVASRQVLQKNDAGEPTAVLEINRDITARKEAEKKAESLGRLYRLLSRVNETIVRARDREGLYRDVCRVAVEEGRFRMAWVGIVDQDAQAIKVAAQFGFDEGYLENLVIPLADVPEGRGPTGTAVREGRLDICHDYAAEPRMAPWREAALARGYRSSAAFPLRVAAKVVGVLTLYAERPGFFNDEEIGLLQALTGDLSFALESMDREDRRKQAEDIMKARLKLLKLAESHAFEELPQVTLDELEMLTGSTIGFYHLLDADQKTLSLQAWSSNTLRNMCTTEGKGRHYNIAEAGVWVDCVRQRRPVIHNDYAALPNRKGIPPGHAPVRRELVVPIFRGDRIVAIIGVGNKPADYNKRDIEVLSTLGDIWWDIAERKRVVEGIAKLNEELEQRVTERTAQLEAANKELEAFSYSVSHDLKAPIRAIEGFSRMLAAEHAARLEAEGLRFIEVICQNTRIMAQLIDDLLALSRLGRQTIRKSVINLGAMTRRVFEQLRDQEPDRDLQLTLGELPPALGDPALLNQVMMNLLANAIKYTKSRETAAIAVEGRIEAQETIYCVRDNGVGFDERYAHKLFGVFQRLHGSQEYEGTGVGLAIVQRIVERHGGRVWAAGKVSEGATFYFSLPRGPQSGSEPK